MTKNIALAGKSIGLFFSGKHLKEMKVIKTALEKEGCQIATISHYRELEEIMHHRPAELKPHLILFDWSLIGGLNSIVLQDIKDADMLPLTICFEDAFSLKSVSQMIKIAVKAVKHGSVDFLWLGSNLCAEGYDGFDRRLGDGSIVAKFLEELFDQQNKCLKKFSDLQIKKP